MILLKDALQIVKGSNIGQPSTLTRMALSTLEMGQDP
ncbi:hypothetical protein JOC94_002536 [Bacillus thermophilus]|uniref:Uncharacterized protein n=1 Tax=Siminovitchia thermophila TaxID=1245522 RepID=A0ABS2R7B4_9BACI|nr:hypothetical protein [Siminovitchia thermophila]